MPKELSKLDHDELESISGGKIYYMVKFGESAEILDETGKTLSKFPDENKAKEFFESKHKNDELKLIKLSEYLRLKGVQFPEVKHSPTSPIRFREPLQKN